MVKENFIAKSEAKHGVGTYDYDKIPLVVLSNQKVQIKCPKHGYFFQRASAHYSGQGCPQCGKEKLWDNRERFNTDIFVARAKEIWGNEYDYSLVKCDKARGKVKIICRIHGIFEQQITNHLHGQGCPKCSTLKRSSKLRLGKKEIIKRAIEKHGLKYDYSLVETDKSNEKIKIICPKHGIFEQIAFHHLAGTGCPKCALEEKANKKRLSNEEFISRATKKHNSFYTYDKCLFTSTKKCVIITCPIHGDFRQKAGMHLKGCGCPKCAFEKNGLRCRLTQEEFIKRAKEIHGDNYNYDKTKYETYDKKVTITCKIHGDFLQSPSCHLNGNGCPKCHRSKGENKISSFLGKFNIEFEIQKKINNYNIFGGRIYFLVDFYLPKYNTIIEYNGEQHYKPVGYFGGEKNYEIQQQRDMSLQKYCYDNKIKLIEIPYWDFDNIEEILIKELKLKKK